MTSGDTLTTAVDSNVLIDVLTDAPSFGRESWARIVDAHQRGPLVICEVVYAELANVLPSRRELDARLEEMHISQSPIDFTIAYEAGVRFSQYRRAGGPRTRVLPDFLIGAHAIIRANALLTRDRGIFATYFSDLQLT